MRLGNSGGNNEGKCYLMRATDKMKSTEVTRKRAEEFNNWFQESFDSIVLEMKDKEMYDSCVLNETYLKMYEGVLYRNLIIKDNRSYFFRAFYTNSVQGKVRMNRYTELPDTYDNTEDGDEDSYQVQKLQKQLEEDIFEYIHEKYDLRDFELFKIYVSLKPAINYSILSDITNLKVHRIQTVISTIKKDICSHSDFMKRRRELVA